ncbi:alkaline shock response membrane anchor protein AmaP [Actinocorallia longicatena]|uniref:Alkaline shock response membrane anchor protein AmaP n=1 Tax=Actinocorallia longicatena TaxID=111803 RepID=A0ABP6QP72_9ACTN
MGRRVALALAGLALCAAGGLVVWFGFARGDDTVVTGDPGESSAWFWPVVIAVLTAVTIGGLAWLLTQGRGAALRRFVLMGGSRRMMTKAATAELAQEIIRLPGVRDVRIRLTGSHSRPRLVLSVFCEESADLGMLLGQIGEQSVGRFRSLVAMPELHAVLRFRLVYRETRVA